MFKNKYNKYQNLIYEIFEQFQISDQSICLITKNNQESIYIYNGLKYFFDEDRLNQYLLIRLKKIVNSSVNFTIRFN